jgi:hypothetical protein
MDLFVDALALAGLIVRFAVALLDLESRLRRRPDDERGG